MRTFRIAALLAALRSKRASASVEGAIYFPMTILCVLFVMQMLIFYYCSVSLSSHMHIELRDKAGETAQTTYVTRKAGTSGDSYSRAADAKKITMKQGKSGIRDVLNSSVSADFRDVFMKAGSLKQTHADRAYLIDESRLLRALNVLP